jgi:dihydroneopterin aldolase
MAKPRADRGGRDRGIVVVKISGGLVAGSRIRSILGIVGRARRPVVVVAGGGALSEGVGRLKDSLGLSQAAACRMTMLAMHQTAMAIADLQPRLTPVETIASIRQALAAGRVPVWLPLRMSDRDHAFPTGSPVGSDGLAARLAERLGAILVLLVKPHRIQRAAKLVDLAAEGLVDDAFVGIVARAGLRHRVLGPGEAATLAEVVGALPARGQVAHTGRPGTGRGRRLRRQSLRGIAHGKA